MAVVLATGLLPFLTGAATAQSRASEYISASSDTTCDELRPVVCIYPGGNYTGAFQAWFPDAAGGFWISLTNDTGMKLPWGSFHDFSGSSVAFGDASTGQRKCYVAGSSAAYPSVTSYRYMWIEYGVTGCTGTLGPLP